MNAYVDQEQECPPLAISGGRRKVGAIPRLIDRCELLFITILPITDQAHFEGFASII